MADQRMLGGVLSHEGVKTQKDLKGKSRLKSLSQVRMALADAESELLQAAYVLDEACSQGKTVKSDLVIPFAHMMGEQAQCSTRHESFSTTRMRIQGERMGR